MKRIAQEFPEFVGLEQGNLGLTKIYLSAEMSEERRYELLAILPEGIYDFQVEEIEPSGEQEGPSHS